MKVLRDDLVKMFVACGYKAAGKWNKVRMERKLKELVALGSDSDLAVEEGTEDEEKLNKIIKGVIKAKGVVEIMMEEEAPEEEAPEEEAPEEEEIKPAKPKKAVKTEKTEKAEEKKPKKAIKVTRHACCVKCLIDCKGKTALRTLAEKIDGLYVKNGGKSSKVDSYYMAKCYADVLVGFGIATLENDNIVIK
jgi:hypothetical protein